MARLFPQPRVFDVVVLSTELRYAQMGRSINPNSQILAEDPLIRSYADPTL
jgi:hypothetical protein